MKKIFLSIVAFSAVLSSCNNEEAPTVAPVLDAQKPQLEVDFDFGREVSTRSVTGRPIDAFTDGDEVGLFVSDGTGVNNPYNQVAGNKNARATKNGRWSLPTAVYLSPANATIYSYYPYSASVTDGTQMAVNHTSQTDFLYGNPVTNINNRNVKANITFNHALTLVQFNIKKGTYTGAGQLTAIKIENGVGKTALKSDAKLNITNGQLVKGTATTAVTRGTNLPATIGNGWSEAQMVKSLVIPTDNGAEGDIVIKFTIDNQEFTMKVPANHGWEQGKKNTYTITLNGHSLDINSSDIRFDITTWGNGLAHNHSLS